MTSSSHGKQIVWQEVVFSQPGVLMPYAYNRKSLKGHGFVHLQRSARQMFFVKFPRVWGHKKNTAYPPPSPFADLVTEFADRLANMQHCNEMVQRLLTVFQELFHL